VTRVRTPPWRCGEGLSYAHWYDLRSSVEVSVAGQPVKQGTTGGYSVLGTRPLPTRHFTTVDQNC
jgi:hypothetical protein